MDIAFTIIVWLGLAALAVYGWRLIDALEEPTTSSGGGGAAAAPVPEQAPRVLVGAGSAPQR